LSLKHYGDSEEVSRVGVEDWMELVSNPTVEFSDFVNAEKTTMMSTTLTLEEVWQLAADVVKPTKMEQRWHAE
jgi:hypothetical protein